MRPLERWLVVAVCLAVGWFYGWTVRSSGDPWNFGKEQRDYYNLLIDGYLDGHLHMKVEVPDALLKLKNPYDPGERPPGLGLHDASFYRGNYYVYFGVAPMVVLMLPFRLLTGIDLPQPVAALVFIYGGFLASTAVWLLVRRRYFPETGTLTALCGVLVLGLAGVGPVLLRRPHMWELPIGGGYFFAMVMLFCVWRSLHPKPSRHSSRYSGIDDGSAEEPESRARRPHSHESLSEGASGRHELKATKRQAWWLAAASLCLGLAVASRPTYLFACPCLVAPLWWSWRNARHRFWRMAVSGVVPLAIVGSAMAWHNYARFENPLEFGQTYQFSLDYESKLPHFRAAYIPFNLRAHFFSGAQWSRYFPFIRRPDHGEAPKGFTVHRGDVYGLLIDFPIAWLALLAPLALWRRTNVERALLGTWIATVALLFAACAAFLLSFFSVLARYQMDFAPALMLLSGVGLLALDRWLQQAGTRTWRWIGRVAVVGASAFSAGFGIIFSLQFDGLLRERNPVLEQKVARTLNRFPATIERLLGVHHGPVQLAVRFPISRRPGRETLLTSGDLPRLDRVFVQYRDDGRIQLGVACDAAPEIVTRALAIDPRATHDVRVTLGSLYPPVAHPFFAGKSADEIRRLTREVRLEFDGEPVLIEHRRAADAGSGRLRAGSEALVNAAYPRFSGAIVSTPRRDETTAANPALGPFVRLRLAFAAGATGCEPLVSFGDASNSIVITASNAGARALKFGVRGPRVETIESDPVAVTFGRAHEFMVRVEGTRVVGRRRICIWLEDELVLGREVAWSAAMPATMVAGKNIAGVSGCGEAFSGQIFSVQQDAAGVDPIQGPGDTLRIRIQLPAERAGNREPLVVTGRNGAGDILMLDYVDGQTVRFALDHWGSPMQVSKPLRIDFARPHEVEVSMTSLATFPDATLVHEVRWGRVRLAVDGEPIWEQGENFFSAEADEIAIGRNPIGGTTSGPIFTGNVLSVERVVRE